MDQYKRLVTLSTIKVWQPDCLADVGNNVFLYIEMDDGRISKEFLKKNCTNGEWKEVCDF